MASTINASNSGFGGIVSTGDSSGQLQLQTANTTAVTIDTSQNVGIGRASSGYKLEVNDTSLLSQNAGSSTATVGTALTLDSKTSGAYATGQGSALQFQTTNSGGAYAGCKIASIHNADNYTANLVFYPRNYGYTEAMRIDSNGNLLVGTTGTFDMGFGTQKFNSRTTNQSAGFFDITDGTNEPILLLANATSTGYTNRMVDMRTNMATGTGFTAYSYMSNTNTLRFYVRGDGVIFSTSTTISAISDVRHKENIRELDTGLKEVLQLQPRRFDWKENQGTNEKDVPGFIAQEVEKVIPELVEDWRNEGEEETYKALKMGNMIPTLVKAIQEQQTIINDLKARIETLESK